MIRSFLVYLVIYFIFLICIFFYLYNIFSLSNEKESHNPDYHQYNSENFSCGIKNHKRSKRIINGKRVSNSAWPWDVKLYYYGDNNKKRLLGSGTIIHPRFVITSSSSFDPIPDKRVYITNDYISNIVSKTISHPNYREETHSRTPNVALLLLEKPIKFDEFTQPICLPKDNLTLVNKEVYVTGWGRSDEGAHRIFLREAKVRVLSNKDTRCNVNTKDVNHYSAYYYCVLDTKRNSTPCFGDSNLYYSINSTWYIFGVIGFFKTNNNYCSFKKTSYFSKVYEYLTWIEQNIEELNI